MKKAQSGIEFIILYGAVFLFFVLFIVMIYSSIEKKNYEKKDIAMSIEANYVADEIALAHEAGPGYERNFTLPQTILGSNYYIEIQEKDSIYVYTTDGSGTFDNKHAMSISCLDVSYAIPVGGEDRFEIKKSGANIIKNIDGNVTISK